MTPSPPLLWILRLVPDVRFGRLLSALVTLAGLLAFYAAAGVFSDAATVGARPHVAAFFAVILAYIVPTFHYIATRCEEAFDELAPHLRMSEDDLARRRASIRRRSVGAQLAMLTIGVVAGLAHNLALAGRFGIAAALTGSAAAAITFGTFLVWIVMTTAILGLVAIARLFASLARRVRIDLLQPTRLRPFARVAVISTLAMVGAEAAFPILSLDGPRMFPVTMLPGLAAVFVSMVLLFVLPLLPVQAAIAAAKRAETERINLRIAELSHAPASEDERLARLAPLLTYRRAVEQAREWPFDTGTASRLAFYLIIPPLTWIAAAVIQRVVDFAL